MKNSDKKANKIFGLASDECSSSPVHNKNLIDVFNSMFKYAPSKASANQISKSDLLYVFLLSIIQNENTYEKSTSSDNILAVSTGKNDEDLNGFDLFNKYIAYDLGDEILVGRKEKFVYNESVLSPNGKFFAYSKNPRRVDVLIALFASELQRRNFFDDAISMYDLYLAQQPDTRSIDCILARLYIEYAKNMCSNVNAQRTSSYAINIKSIRIDLLKLVNSSDDASSYESLYDEIEKISEEQKEFSETEKLIKKVIDGTPEKIVANLAQLQSANDEIDSIFSSIEQEFVKNELRSNYSRPINELKRVISDSKAAKGIVGFLFYGEIGDETAENEEWAQLCKRYRYSRPVIDDTNYFSDEVKASFNVLTGMENAFDSYRKYLPILGEYEEKVSKKIDALEKRYKVEKAVFEKSVESAKALKERKKANRARKLEARRKRGDAWVAIFNFLDIVISLTVAAALLFWQWGVCLKAYSLFFSTGLVWDSLMSVALDGGVPHALGIFALIGVGVSIIWSIIDGFTWKRVISKTHVSMERFRRILHIAFFASQMVATFFVFSCCTGIKCFLDLDCNACDEFFGSFGMLVVYGIGLLPRLGEWVAWSGFKF